MRKGELVIISNYASQELNGLPRNITKCAPLFYNVVYKIIATEDGMKRIVVHDCSSLTLSDQELLVNYIDSVGGSLLYPKLRLIKLSEIQKSKTYKTFMSLPIHNIGDIVFLKHIKQHSVSYITIPFLSCFSRYGEVIESKILHITKTYNGKPCEFVILTYSGETLKVPIFSIIGYKEQKRIELKDPEYLAEFKLKSAAPILDNTSVIFKKDGEYLIDETNTIILNYGKYRKLLTKTN